MSFIDRVVESLGGTSSYGDNHYVSCPMAPYRHEKGGDRSGSFSLKLTAPNKAVGYCWACGWTGNLWMLARDLEKEGDPLAREIRRHVGDCPTFDDIAEYWNDQIEEDEMAKEVVPYECDLPRLEDGVWPRIPTGAAEVWDLRWDESTKSVWFPVLDVEGRIRGCQYRPLFGDGKSKYINTPGFKKAMFLYGEGVAFSDRVIIVEGPVDAIKTQHITGRHTVAIFGNTVSKTQAKRIATLYKTVDLFLDNDAAGWKGTSKTIALLLENGVDRINIIDYKGLGYKDPGELPDELLVQFVNDALPVEVQ